MRPRPSLMLTLPAAIILAVGGGRAQQPKETAEAKKPAPQQAAEPAPPTRATVTRSPLGILVITGASSAPAPGKGGKAETAEGEQAGKDPDTGEGKEAGQSGGEAETPAPASAPATPSSTRSASAGYGLSGQRTSGGISISGTSAGGSSQTTHALANINGNQVPYLTESQEVLSQTETESVIERRTHRYDTAGRAASQQMVREERRTLADGSLETIVTVYESDPSGRMHPAGRTVSVEKKVGNTTRTTRSSERPDASGRLRAYQREESVRTQEGENAARIETVRSVDNVRGRFIESEREVAVMSKSGKVSKTETKLWRRSVLNQDRITLASRTVGTIVENSDGSTSEKIDVFAHSSGGGAYNLNRGGTLALQQTVEREKRKAADGSVTETTKTRSRSISDPSRFGPGAILEKVTRPTANGETIESHSYEQGVNGRMRVIGSTVETTEKQ